MQSSNPALRDPSMFRIIKSLHPLLGSKYRVYPLYNFASTVVDHEIKTTHILRDHGFENDAMIQEYLFKILDWKVPEIIQFGRIKTIADIPMKKRKIKELIEKGLLTDFEDIRIPTPRNLLKRGFRPEAIKRLIEEIGPSKNDISISSDVLETYNRQLIDKQANRYFFVGDPIEIVLSELPFKIVKAPIYPGKRTYRKIPTSKKILVDKIDFTQYREKEVRLMHFCNVVLDKSAKVTGKSLKDIPKIHWVPPKSVKISLIMPDGRIIEGFAEPEIKNVKTDDVVQFERMGFARYDGNNVFYFAHK
jgi:glutamyl-tRNA synthetase